MKPATLAAICLAALAVPIAAHASDRFGALSFARRNANFAVELDLPTREAAERAALTSCRKLGSDCWSAVWVMNGCVSIAVGQAHGYGTGWGSTRAAAEVEALNVCTAHVGGCSVRHTACTQGF